MNRRQFTISSILAAVGLPAHIRELFSGTRDLPITMAEVDAMRRAVNEFERGDATVGGGLVARAAATLHDELAARLRTTSVDTSAYRSLQGLHADIAAWVGWLSFDAGDLARSRQYLSEAITHARMIGDVDVEVRSMAYYCLVLAREQRYTEMLQCAQTALAAAISVSPSGGDKVTSLLHLRAASAHAWLGDRLEFDRGVERAQSSFNNPEAEPVPLWLNFFNQSEVQGLTAFGMMSLGDHQQAVSTFAAMVSSFDPAYYRNSVYYTAVLADSMRQVGDVEEASETAISILPSAARLQSGRVAQTLQRLAAELTPYAGDVPSARDFISAYQEIKMTGSALNYEVLDVDGARDRFDALVECYVDVYSDTDDPFFGEDRYRKQLNGHMTAPSWMAITATKAADSRLVGYIYGFTLAASSRWWEGIATPDEAFTRESGTRTVAISEIMVRAPWRRTGVAHRLHDLFLSERAEERATLLVEPENGDAQRAYASWGWRKVNQLLPGWEGAPLYDVLILNDLPRHP